MRSHWLFPCALLACILLAQQPASRPEGVPVRIDGKEILRVYSSLGPDSAVDRAREIETRLAQLAEKQFAGNPAVQDLPEAGLSIVMLGPVVVMTVTAEDAAAAGMSRDALAQRHGEAIRQAIDAYGRAHFWLDLLLSIVKALLAWALFVGLAWLVKRGFDWTTAWIQLQFQTLTEKRQVRGLNLLLWERLFLFLLLLLKIVVGFFLLFQLSLLISYTFGLFPATAGLSTSLFEYFRSTFGAIGMAVVDYLPSGGFVAILAVITFYGLRLMRIFFRALERGDISLAGFHPEAALPTFQLLRILVLLFVLVVAFPYLPGGKSDAFKGVSIFIGVLLSLGSGSAMGNITAGVIITYMRPFRIGDVVKIADTMGEVKSKGLLVTRVLTPKNVEVVIPNSAILNNQILNFSALSREQGLVLHTTVTIGYDVPWRRVHELLKEAALATPGILPRPEPFVLQTALNDHHVSYELNACTGEPARMPALYSALHESIQEKFNAAGVEIMSPGYHAIRDGNTTTVPEPHRPPDYRPQPFRVSDSSG